MARAPIFPHKRYGYQLEVITIKIRLIGSTRPRGGCILVWCLITSSRKAKVQVYCLGKLKQMLNLEYKGLKAWYYAEPRKFSIGRAMLFRQTIRRLAEHEFLHHSNPNPAYRYPCVTFASTARCHWPRTLKKRSVCGGGEEFWRTILVAQFRRATAQFIYLRQSS